MRPAGGRRAARFTDSGRRRGARPDGDADAAHRRPRAGGEDTDARGPDSLSRAPDARSVSRGDAHDDRARRDRHGCSGCPADGHGRAPADLRSAAHDRGDETRSGSRQRRSASDRRPGTRGDPGGSGASHSASELCADAGPRHGRPSNFYPDRPADCTRPDGRRSDSRAVRSDPAPGGHRRALARPGASDSPADLAARSDSDAGDHGHGPAPSDSSPDAGAGGLQRRSRRAAADSRFDAISRVTGSRQLDLPRAFGGPRDRRQLPVFQPARRPRGRLRGPERARDSAHGLERPGRKDLVRDPRRRRHVATDRRPLGRPDQRDVRDDLGRRAMDCGARRASDSAFVPGARFPDAAISRPEGRDPRAFRRAAFPAAARSRRSRRRS